LQADARFRRQDGQWIDVQWSLLIVRDSVGAPSCQIGQIVDISHRKEDEKKLRHYATVLDQSNRDLQDFAYVASHDLQEPLRMVKSYLELLSRRYHNQIDSDADQFISFALDGATRMQQLVSGLLAYARVGTQSEVVHTINSAASLEAACANLHMAITESGAEITVDSLPRLEADGLMMTQLFQNLIANSIKFRSQDPPRIHVGVQDTGEGWQFRVSDNGIGLPPHFASRAFQIFQRLHSHSKYPGAGLGLAICKRIVEWHGGEIRVESQPGQGSTFIFDIPARESVDAA
jgi:light-regulated signal transduction histidine kinase (bacteriophytochrome)